MDVRSYFASSRFAVVVAGIAVAIPTGFLVTDLLGNDSLGFLTMFVLGVSVPRTYSRSWPEHDDRLHAVAWAMGACAAALAVLLVAHVATSAFLDEFWGAVGAFLVVEVLLSAVSRSFESATESAGDDSATTDVDGSD
ncbi:hypothetical protein [Halorubellus sp. PRR65]|uniref:hypothetical protein n=1 Tax=Halorubellus sp. PRR65 TaxID=3098148 RepID=UPI002B25C784|nr:hypothetical protein [Halorubellus sp. PRR65]